MRVSHARFLLVHAIVIGVVGSGCSSAPPSNAGTGGAIPGGSRIFTDVVKPEACVAGSDCPAGRCLPFAVARSPQEGRTDCAVIDVPEDGSACDPAVGLMSVDAKLHGPTRALFHEHGACDVAGAPACNSMSVCARMEATGSALQSCLNDATLPAGVGGWCYLDPASGAGGSAALVDKCEPDERRMLRFLPLAGNHTLAIFCFSIDATSAPAAAGTGRTGDPSVPSDETRTDFGGYTPNEVVVEGRSPSCENGVAIVYGFSGRVGCPYGQPPDPSDPAHVDPARQTCFTPSGEPVTVPVRAQLATRPPSSAVYCSCRCGGPDANASYCTCPDGFECKKLVDDLGLSGGGGQSAGSYCIKSGTEYSPSMAAPTCDPQIMNCGPRP